jgi:hypothetical protein
MEPRPIRSCGQVMKLKIRKRARARKKNFKSPFSLIMGKKIRTKNEMKEKDIIKEFQAKPKRKIKSAKVRPAAEDNEAVFWKNMAMIKMANKEVI